MNTIMDAVDRIRAKWRTLPKWFRFIAYYATSIVWVPMMVVIAILALPVAAVLEWAIDAWDRFDYD